MNETVKTQLNHKTIRKFKDKKIDKETMDILFDVAVRSASSNGMYSYSMIHVTDKQKKSQIAKVCAQPYVESTSDLVVFLVDIYRNRQIAIEKGLVLEHLGEDMDNFLQGTSDALISAQNMVVAAESMGIGTVFFGSILGDISKMCEILKLPELTFPIMAVGLGYSDVEPALKPRLPKKIQIFENEYETFDNYSSKLKEFDEEMNKYFDTRDMTVSVGKFSTQIFNKMKNSKGRNRNLIEEVEKRGFKTKLI